MPSNYPTFSTRFLIASFLIALPLFMFIRWDSTTWLTKQVAQATASTGYTLHYDKVSLSGLGISFDHIQVSKPNMLQIKLDSLDASLSFANLFSGTIAANIHAQWNSNPISVTASQEGELIKLSNINAEVDLAQLESTFAKMPAKVSGQMTAQGNISIHAQTGQPQAGQLDIAWNQAMAGLAKPEFDLGDYQFYLASAEDINQPWAWNISGGTGVALNGSGSFSPQNPNPKLWNIGGDIAIQADNSNPSLAMMVQAISGSAQANVRFSGTVERPHTEIVR